MRDDTSARRFVGDAWRVFGPQIGARGRLSSDVPTLRPPVLGYVAEPL